MKTLFYPRLALSNIKKNSQIYIPYILTSAFMVMMYYLMYSLSNDEAIESMKAGGTTTQLILDYGVYVVGIFSVIFLFYMNSFILKRRKKEFALYNILGMEKYHVMLVLLFESLFIMMVSIVLGIIYGLLFNRLIFLIFIKLVHFSTDFTLSFDASNVLNTCLIFIPLFLLAYLFNALQIRLSHPIELLRGGQTGEKEPKVKWLILIIGIITLSAGYILAQTIEDPGIAIALFFGAVILVMIGTYCLFTSGSIALLKLLKNNRHYYYQTKHFVSVSQLLYRMKQNAVGLASICLLCTCILVIFSSTVTLYLGIEETVMAYSDSSYSASFQDVGINEREFDESDMNQLYNQIEQLLIDNDIDYDMINIPIYGIATLSTSSNKVVDYYNSLNDSTTVDTYFMTVDDYNQTYHESIVLEDNEILVSSNYLDNYDILTFGQDELEYVVQSTFTQKHLLPIKNENYGINDDALWLVFSDENQIRQVSLSIYYNNTIKEEAAYNLDSTKYFFFIDYDKSNDDIYPLIDNLIDEYASHYTHLSYNYDSQGAFRNLLQEVYGSVLFLGVFLGILFLLAAIIMMYYKQLSEGYEDRERYEIMQNVGMSLQEVKQCISSQVLIFFFLPLVVAMIHMAFAFRMIKLMFQYLVVTTTSTMLYYTLIVAIILIAIYAITYSITARTYYKIVKQ
ncbi:MAG: FtsX-like permease family protein [Erysipelotrichaceae bacterium]|nr:FtsX-like permease family protein [Erysipelotrichaceae bacterium]